MLQKTEIQVEEVDVVGDSDEKHTWLVPLPFSLSLTQLV